MDVSIISSLPPYALYGILLSTVILSAALVFVFSFKSVGEPPFSEKKPAGKKRKPKEKKSQNGHAVVVPDKQAVKTDKKKDAQKSPAKKSEKVKQNEAKKEKTEGTPKENKRALKEKAQPKEKKAEGAKNSPKENKPVKEKQSKGKENVEAKVKTNLLRLNVPKRKEDGGGEWEQAISRKERRARKALQEELANNVDGDGLPQRRGRNKSESAEEKGNKKDVKKEKAVSKIDSVESNDSAVDNVETVAPSKKVSEPKPKPAPKIDEPPVGSSTVYDEFAEVFKEPSKKAIKKRVRKDL